MRFKRTVIALFFGTSLLLLWAYQFHREDSTITKNETAVYMLLQAAVQENQKLKLTKGTYATSLKNLDSFERKEFTKAMEAYHFSYRGDVDFFRIYANPQQTGKTGWEHFYVDQSGVIRHQATGPAGASSEPVVTR